MNREKLESHESFATMSFENSNKYWCTLIEQVAMPLSEEEEETEAIMVHLAEELQKIGYLLGSKTIIVAVK
jgi:hypothetical protein